MMLIGSRAIRLHLPDFREPKDWDLIGTRSEAERLRQTLGEVKTKYTSSYKVNFRLDGAPVEFVIIEEFPHWAKLHEHFKGYPTRKHPLLGEYVLPPASFLMLTKHCALGYPVLHWHKNMAEVYWMRNYIKEIPEHVAQTVPILQDKCAEAYEDAHGAASKRPTSCHPKTVQFEDQALHTLLHERFKLGDTPIVHQEGAWQAFPQLTGAEKESAMLRVLAEEAMVLAGYKYLSTRYSANLQSGPTLKRYALRTLLTGGLPHAWRYFGVNNYRELASLIPEDFMNDMGQFDDYRPNNQNACSPMFDQILPDDIGATAGT